MYYNYFISFFISRGIVFNEMKMNFCDFTKFVPKTFEDDDKGLLQTICI